MGIRLLEARGPERSPICDRWVGFQREDDESESRRERRVLGKSRLFRAVPCATSTRKLTGNASFDLRLGRKFTWRWRGEGQGGKGRRDGLNLARTRASLELSSNPPDHPPPLKLDHRHQRREHGGKSRSSALQQPRREPQRISSSSFGKGGREAGARRLFCRQARLERDPR